MTCLCFMMWMVLLLLGDATSALQLLAKTTETFKLADLVYLEARLEIPSCQRLVLDAATGSSLLLMCDSTPTTTLQRRCDWIGELLVRSGDPLDLIDQVRQLDIASPGWILDYARMTSDRSKKQPEYTAKSLQTCVAQAISTPPQLNPVKATDRLLLVDTIDEIFLVRLLASPAEDEEPRTMAWWSSSRPFQYSSAINPTVAEIVIDVLLLLQLSRDRVRGPKLLDPTCGSGTFLALALTRGMKVEGWDVNPACIDGTTRNLKHFFDDDSKWSVQLRDAAASLDDDDDDDPVDALVANLPWGQNTIAYKDENAKILQNVAQMLQPGTPCAFISKDSLQLPGYNVLGVATVPPKGFVLPKGKGSTLPSKGTSSNCVVTIALSP